MSEEFYDRREIQGLLGIGKTNFYKKINDGTIPSIRVGHLIRVPKKAFDSWVERQTKEDLDE